MRNWLKAMRNEKKMSQQTIAGQIGIRQATYCNIENNLRNPSVSIAKKIANVLNFDWRLFYPDEDTEAVKKAM